MHRLFFLFLCILFISLVHAAQISIVYNHPWSIGASPEYLVAILEDEGHEVQLHYDWYVPTSVNEIGVFFPEFEYPPSYHAPDSRQRVDFREWIFSGGFAIGVCIGSRPGSLFSIDAWHLFLSDSDWIENIGGMQLENYWSPLIWPESFIFTGWDSLGPHISTTQFFPPLNTIGLDTIFVFNPNRITFIDSSSFGDYGIFLRGDPEYIPGSDLGWPFGAYAYYGEGLFMLLGSIMFISDNVGYVPPCEDTLYTLMYGDNAQFVRNLFTTNNRADSAWLTGTDSTFTIFLPGCTPFVAGSTSFNFEFGTHGLWELHASDWLYWHTDSSITIQYPDTCPMGVTFEVCVNLVPDATGETVLPTGPVCDSFAFNYTGIEETPTPEHFSISAYPNPFNSAVKIVAPEKTTLEIFDINGKHITKLSKNESIWRPPECVSSGIYLIRAINGLNSASKRVLYIK